MSMYSPGSTSYVSSSEGSHYSDQDQDDFNYLSEHRASQQGFNTKMRNESDYSQEFSEKFFPSGSIQIEYYKDNDDQGGNAEPLDDYSFRLFLEEEQREREREVKMSMSEPNIEPNPSSLGIPRSTQSKEREKALTLEDAFQLLLKASENVLDPNIPIRAHASPICPSENLFYVSQELAKTNKNKKRRREEQSSSMNAQPEIRVKFQSFHNTEIWWSPEKDYCMGVIARAMSRKSRSQANNPAEAVKFHGFVGCLYSLIQRSPETRDSPVPRSVKSFVVEDVPSLVRFTSQESNSNSKLGINMSLKKTTVKIIESEVQGSLLTVPQPLKYEAPLLKKALPPIQIERDVVISSALSVQSLHVKGDLHVEGTISGQLITPPGAADYAEWFAYLDPSENISEGMVVQLKSPEQKITLDTSGDGPHLIVSTKPSIAAGVDNDVPGALCGFIGQVPVKVSGPVKVGETLFPSGKHDGLAVAGNTTEHGHRHDPIGTAMIDCGEGTHTVLAFIRWQHNLKWQSLKRKEDRLKDAIMNMTQYILPTFALLVWWFADLARGERSKGYRNAFLGFSLVPLWVTLHLPGYHQFMSRDIYWILPILFGGSVFNIKLLIDFALYGTNNDRGKAMMHLLSFMNLASIVLSSIKLKIASIQYASSVDDEPSWWEKNFGYLWSFRRALNWDDVSKEIVEKNRREKEIIGKLLFKKL